MKTFLFIWSAAVFSIYCGVEIVKRVDPLPPSIIYYAPAPTVEKPSLSQTIETETQRHGLPEGLIEAVIEQESEGKSKAKNPEPKLCAEMTPKGWRKADCMSRGLMGVVYGWHKDKCGLKKPSDLYDPITNVQCGAAVLKEKITLAKGDIQRGLNLYNGDKSGRYARAVTAKWRKVFNG